MYFKLVHLIENLGITFAPEEELIFRHEDEQKTEVILRPLTKTEINKFKKSELLHCIAKCEQEPPSDILEMLNRLAANLMPANFIKPKPLSSLEPDKYPYVDDEGRLQEKATPSVFLYPKNFQEFESQMHSELSKCIQQTVKTIRWTIGSNSKHNPISSTLGLSWSHDGQRWREMPHDLSFKFNFNILIHVYGELFETIQSLVRENNSEPLAHDLFLEAWEQRESNPRSALILGVVSAEVGIKQCIAKLVPSAQWLADNSPSPPLAKIISNYLPTLPAKLKIQGKVFAPPKDVRKSITEGVELRNKTIHVGKEPPQKERLEELLLAIRDLLYLLDYYCGYEWAVNNIRKETINAMANEYSLNLVHKN